jgi:hypothetical protein
MIGIVTKDEGSLLRLDTSKHICTNSYLFSKCRRILKVTEKRWVSVTLHHKGGDSPCKRWVVPGETSGRARSLRPRVTSCPNGNHAPNHGYRCNSKHVVFLDHWFSIKCPYRMRSKPSDTFPGNQGQIMCRTEQIKSPNTDDKKPNPLILLFGLDGHLSAGAICELAGRMFLPRVTTAVHYGASTSSRSAERFPTLINGARVIIQACSFACRGMSG